MMRRKAAALRRWADRALDMSRVPDDPPGGRTGAHIVWERRYRRAGAREYRARRAVAAAYGWRFGAPDAEERWAAMQAAMAAAMRAARAR